MNSSTLCRLLALTALLLYPTFGWAEAVEEDHEGGIIGTGIVGTITELGSIHVNGQRIFFAPDTQVSSVLGPLPASELRAGDTVAVIVHPAERDWSAQVINRQFAIVGPVAARTGDHLAVMGTTIAVGPGAMIEEVGVGDWIAVSGFWQGSRIISSKVESITPRPLAYIRGSYLPSPDPGPLLIGNTRISAIAPDHVSSGDVIHVEGIPSDDGLAATRLWPDTLLTRMGIMSVQGYLSTPNSIGFYTLLGSGLVAFTDQAGMVDPSERTIRCGAGQQFIDVGAESTSAIERDILRRLGCQ